MTARVHKVASKLGAGVRLRGECKTLCDQNLAAVTLDRHIRAPGGIQAFGFFCCGRWAAAASAVVLEPSH